MLASIRRAHKSWIVGGLLGLVMIAFVITGVDRKTGGIGDFTQHDDIATIGSESVTAAEVDQELKRELSKIRQEQPGIDMAAMIREGAFDELVSQMIRSEAMNAFGKANGLTTSQKMVDGEIASVPAFHNAAGRFDDTSFRQALANNKITEAELRKMMTTQLLQRQLLVPVADSARTPNGVAREYAALLLETRTGSVGLVPGQAVGPGKDPTDAETNAYLQKNPSRYQIPERRVLRYAAFGQAEVAAAAKPTDAEIEAYYKRNAATYAPKETRTLSQVVIPDERSARAFAAKLASGRDFSEVAKEAGFSVADTAIGAQNKADLARLSSPAVADAAFAAPKGGTTQPARSPLGWHILKVDAITASAGRPLAVVRNEIAATLAEQKSQTALADLAAKIEDAISDGSSFDEVVRSNKLQVIETPPVTAAGTAPDVPGFKAPPELAPLLKSGFELTTDDDPSVETIARNQRFALLAVNRIIPATPPPFAQVKDRVKGDLVRDLANKRAKAVAEQIVAKINRGVPARQAFAEAGARLPPIQSVTAKRIQLAQAADGQVPAPLRMMFNIPKGKTRLVPAPAGAGWFIVHLEQVVPGDMGAAASLIPAVQSQLNQAIGQEYAQQFSRAVEQAVDVQRNQAAIDKLKQQLLKNRGAE